ncbi:hypothetical protein [Candidatus Palauibacter sp.]|uniref:hypothetical protein n=1 Tax=Candidatus Palauibacter sp. TaxID=3101350 RepID=UPI003AF26135
MTAAPVSVAAALGLAGTSILWLGVCQNIDASGTVYRRASTAEPDPAAAAAFRHPPGDRWEMTVLADVPTWLWTTGGEVAVVVLEDGVAGV